MATTAQAPAPYRRTYSSWWARHQRAIAPYLFIAPFFLLFVVFGLYPIVYSFWLSFLNATANFSWRSGIRLRMRAPM